MADALPQQQAEPNIIGEVAQMDESSVETSVLAEIVYWSPIAAGLIAIGLFVWRRWYKLSSAPRKPAAFSILEGLALFFVMYSLAALGASFAMTIFDITPSEDGMLTLAESAKQLSGAYAAQGLAALVFAWLIIKSGRAATYTKWPITKSIFLGVGGLLLFLPVFMLVGIIANQITILLTEEPPDPIAHSLLNQLIESPNDVWFYTMSALVLIGAPIMEEILYRGILQQIAIKLGLGRWLSIFAVSVIFVSMHIGAVDYSAMPSLFLISLGFGWVYEKSGRLWASITMHFLFNLTNLLLASLTAAAS